MKLLMTLASFSSANSEAPTRRTWRVLAAIRKSECRLLILAALIPMLYGCSVLQMVGLKSKPSQASMQARSVQPYSVSLTIAVDENVNRDIDGRPSPLKTRLFLTGPTVDFKSSEFADVFGLNTSALNPAPLQTLTLRPGETREIELEGMKSQSRLIVAAAYRNPGETRWLNSILLDVADTVEVAVNLSALAVLFPTR